MGGVAGRRGGGQGDCLGHLIEVVVVLDCMASPFQ
jgi:hypothetical protein